MFRRNSTSGSRISYCQSLATILTSSCAYADLAHSYVVHSTFAISFPLHVLYISATTQHSVITILKTVLVAVQQHLSPKSTTIFNAATFPTQKFLRLIFYLTSGLTVPSLLWFVSVALAP